jgi:hypothetical protein
LRTFPRVRQDGGRIFDSRPRLQISRPLWGLCAAPSSHHHSLFGVPCSILRRAVRPNGAAECSRGWSGAAALRPDAQSRGKRMREKGPSSFIPFSPRRGEGDFSGRRAPTRARVWRFSRRCNELYFYWNPVRGPRPTTWAATQGRPGQRHWAPTQGCPYGPTAHLRAAAPRSSGDDPMNITFTSFLPARPRPAIPPPRRGDWFSDAPMGLKRHNNRGRVLRTFPRACARGYRSAAPCGGCVPRRHPIIIRYSEFLVRFFAVPFAPTGRRNVAAGGAVRPRCGPTRKAVESG